MTPVTFKRMQDARLEADKRERYQRANEIVALIYGFKYQKKAPLNLRRIHRDLTGESRPRPVDEIHPDILEQSRARAARKRARLIAERRKQNGADRSNDS